MKKSADVERPLPHPKVMVDSQEEWDALGAAVVTLGVFRAIDFSEVPIFDGEPVLAGLLGVLKPGKTTASGRPVSRLIIGVRMTNALLVAIDVDMHKLPMGTSFLCCVIFPHEVALFSVEDLSFSFYQLRMPDTWHRYFVFRRPV